MQISVDKPFQTNKDIYAKWTFLYIQMRSFVKRKVSIKLKPLLATMDSSEFKDGKSHFRNSGIERV